MHPNTGITGSPTYAWKGNGGSTLKLIDPAAACLLDLTLAIGARVNGLCLDGQHLGDGAHGILVDKPDYGTTEDSPLIEGCKVSRFSGDGLRLSRIWCFRVRGNMFSENKGHGLSVRGWDGFVLDNWLSLNGGAGYASIGENNAVTITGNRIEWNQLGGLRILNGSHYNITGNYIDRSGPGILFAATPDNLVVTNRIVGRVGYTSITGNMIYRSGRPLWNRPGEDCSAHIVLIGSRGVTVTGNTMVAGLDDENNEGSTGFSREENWSPEYGVVAEGLRNVVIKDNVMDSGAEGRVLKFDLMGGKPGFISSMTNAEDYAGKKLRLRARLKTADLQGGGVTIYFDSQSQSNNDSCAAWSKPISGTTDWKDYDCVIPISGQKAMVMAGMSAQGKSGSVFLKSLEVSLADDSPPGGEGFEVMQMTWPETPVLATPMNLDFSK